MRFKTYFFILVPRNGLRRQDEPIVTRAALHDSQIGDGHPSTADRLIAQLTASFGCVLGSVLGTGLLFL